MVLFSRIVQLRIKYNASTYNGNINDLIYQLKEDLQRELVSRFNFNKLKNKGENVWFLHVNVPKYAEQFPVWCTIESQNQFAEILKKLAHIK